MELTSLLVVSLLLLSTSCLAQVHLENGADFLLVVSLLLLTTSCLAQVHLENGADLPAGGISAPLLHQLSG